LIRTILVDDHELVLRGLQRVLELDSRLQVVGCASTISEALSLCNRLHPDAVVLDLRLPDSRGAAEIPRIKQSTPGAKVLVLTGYGKAREEECLRLGADAFLSKESASDSIVETLCDLFPEVAERARSGLTSREYEVASMMVSGLTNVEIAEALSVSLNTVKTHVANVLRKLNVRDRVGLVRIWAHLGEVAIPNHPNG
jgi:DNA-binding NarL/FixJ family response regulator